MEDVKISGSGTLTGGEYSTVTVNGMGKCTASMRAQEVVVNGTFKVDGAAECRVLTVNGTLKCVGPLSAEESICNGAATVDSDMISNVLSVSGMLHVEGSRLNGGALTCTGILTADGQILCDSLHATGIIKAGVLEGQSIRIRSHRPAALRRFLLSKGLSKVEVIRGKELDLSGVTAEQVFGTEVVIGPDCNIEALHCDGTLSIDPTSTVENISGNYVRR